MERGSIGEGLLLQRIRYRPILSMEERVGKVTE